MPITESVIQLVAWRAMLAFGDHEDELFNTACFSNALEQVTGLKGPHSSTLITMMLTGRSWVIRETDGCHWRLNREPWIQ